jgi:hypothetical protein
MAPAPRAHLDAFLDSPYAADLQRDGDNRYGSPKLEAKYAQARLADARLLIRMACALTVFVTAVRGVEQTLSGSWNPVLGAHVGISLTISVVLAAIAWSPLRSGCRAGP